MQTTITHNYTCRTIRFAIQHSTGAYAGNNVSARRSRWQQKYIQCSISPKDRSLGRTLQSSARRLILRTRYDGFRYGRTQPRHITIMNTFQPPAFRIELSNANNILLDSTSSNRPTAHHVYYEVRFFNKVEWSCDRRVYMAYRPLIHQITWNQEAWTPLHRGRGVHESGADSKLETTNLY